ncbi:TPA: hypothetical protein HA244_02975 [Candidatus Micrarchaeota archaeon]|nr:hypothetical protein [Candidatus Micrarchaeota archaeon]
MKLKPVIAAEHAINWYLGNYLEDPDNALRDDEEIPPKWLEDIADLRKELSEQKMTHRQFLDLVKEKGIHDKYYQYEKYEPPYCPWCDKFGVPR